MKLKLTTLLCAFSLLISYNALAQDEIFGIKGGVNLSNLNGLEGETMTGFSLGVYYEYPISQSFSFQSETMFAHYGAKSKTKLIDDIRIQAFQVPLMAKYYVLPNMSLDFGPQINILFNGKGGAIAKSQYKTFDLGLSVGTTVQLSEYFSLGVRYNHGLSDITKTPTKIQSRVTQFTLGMNF